MNFWFFWDIELTPRKLRSPNNRHYVLIEADVKSKARECHLLAHYSRVSVPPGSATTARWLDRISTQFTSGSVRMVSSIRSFVGAARGMKSIGPTKPTRLESDFVKTVDQDLHGTSDTPSHRSVARMPHSGLANCRLILSWPRSGRVCREQFVAIEQIRLALFDLFDYTSVADGPDSDRAIEIRRVDLVTPSGKREAAETFGFG